MSVSRSLSEVSERETLGVSLDLVSAVRRNIGFLRTVNESPWLHERPAIFQAIRRYDELWMPLVAEITVGSTPPMVLPPLDVEWVWFCHTLNPVNYGQYCDSRFSKLIGKPTIFDEENEEYALNRCREIWVRRYPSEPFENEVNSESPLPLVRNEDLLSNALKQRSLYLKFSEPYMTEIMYLIGARQRYKGFLCILARVSDKCSRFVPTSDILIMWLTHQSYPTVYAEDMKEAECNVSKVARVWETVEEEEVEETKRLWERTFDQPYEKAGGRIALHRQGVPLFKPPVYWEVFDTDVNTKYKSLMPRFLLEVCMFVRLGPKMKPMQEKMTRDFVRLRAVRCHKELKINKHLSSILYDSWLMVWHLYCEFGTKGLIIEFRHRGGRCFKGSKVTDDSGAMISDEILRMNHYRPQEGRWLSRTVLDHAGRECFVVRIRVGAGFWRRGGENPSNVRWEDRITEVREGSWSYVAGSIGRAPEKVVGTAMPKEPPEQWDAAWQFSSGDELVLRSESSTSRSSLAFSLRNQSSSDSSVKLLIGRRRQYKVKKVHPKSDAGGTELDDDGDEGLDLDEEELDFVTVVRITEEHPTGRATALINWKLLAVEFIPEEDAVFVLLLCISMLRSLSEMRKEDLGKLLIRRRVKEAKPGARNWGSVILHPLPSCPTPVSPFLQPWHWNAKAVLASDGADSLTRQPNFVNSGVEGGDALYRRGIMS
ncbi:uncharacterized protein J3R85_003547 [Psidium guajava]|nr:uncharacterized protein J3R85_003547 [Psidium guajava]